MKIFRNAILVVAPVVLFAWTAAGQTQPRNNLRVPRQANPEIAAVHVIASNGMKAVIQELQPGIEAKIGYPLSVDYGPTAGLLQKIAAGEPFDAVILTTEAVTKLVEEGKLASGTRADLARVGVGLAVRAGTPKPDIRTPEALKQTLLGAKSITYAGNGASRAVLDKMFDRLGIAAQVKSRIILTEGSGPGMESVANGQVALVMTLISEMIPVHGIEVVGPLPADLQNWVSFAAACSKDNNIEAARTLIAALKDPAAAPVYKTNGMEPR